MTEQQQTEESTKELPEEIIELARWRVIHRDKDRIEYRFLFQRDGVWICSGSIDFAIDRPEWELLERFVHAFFRDVREPKGAMSDAQ